MYGEEGDYGPLVTVHVLQTNIDIAITDNNHSFVEELKLQHVVLIGMIMTLL